MYLIIDLVALAVFVTALLAFVNIRRKNYNRKPKFSNKLLELHDFECIGCGHKIKCSLFLIDDCDLYCIECGDWKIKDYKMLIPNFSIEPTHDVSLEFTMKSEDLINAGNKESLRLTKP